MQRRNRSNNLREEILDGSNEFKSVYLDEQQPPLDERNKIGSGETVVKNVRKR